MGLSARIRLRNSCKGIELTATLDNGHNNFSNIQNASDSWSDFLSKLADTMDSLLHTFHELAEETTVRKSVIAYD